MSTIDQAFVQAFARRNRRDPNDSKVRISSPSIVQQNVGQVENTVRSDSAQATHWIDPAKDNLLKMESSAATAVPNPHFPTANPPAEERFVNEAAYLANVAESPIEAPAASTSQSESPYISAASAAVVQQRIDSAERHVSAPHIDQAVATPAAIQAAWEVDVFEIPASVTELFFKEDLFQAVAQRLHDAVGEGLGSILVTSAKSGEGRSTVAIGMAMAAAASGIRVALVDGDVSEPTLVDDLRLDVDYGWYDAIRGGLPLGQVAVFSIEDNLTLIPLIARDAGSVQPSQDDIKQLVQSLGQQFDLVVVDAPSGDEMTIEEYASLLDSAVITRDASRTDIQTINVLANRLRSCGLQGIGVVENFV